MGCRFAGRLRAVMAAKARSRDAAMIEGRWRPRICFMAVFADIIGRQMVR